MEASTLFDRSQKMREGTAVPPTIGRVVNLGRRWALIPINEEQFVRRGTSGSGAAPDALQPARPTLLGSGHSRVPLNRGVHLGWDSAPTPHRQWDPTTLVQRTEDDEADTANRSRYITLCENQMLQRIVEATRAEATDDCWEISGEILEFFDENRLLIRTIQRANSN
jgi:hypothetical protein